MSDEFKADDWAVLEREAETPSSASSLTVAARLATELAEGERQETLLEGKLDFIKKRLHHLRTVQVPEAMSAAQLSEFKLAEGEYEGVKVKVGDFVSGSLPKDDTKRQKAVQLLEKYGAASLIKDTVVIEVPKAKGNEIHHLLSEIAKMGFTAERRSDVHQQSLTAFARERLRKGEDVDAETLGLFVGRSTKLTWPKMKAIE